jgi:hypothetical protein
MTLTDIAWIFTASHIRSHHRLRGLDFTKRRGANDEPTTGMGIVGGARRCCRSPIYCLMGAVMLLEAGKLALIREAGK